MCKLLFIVWPRLLNCEGGGSCFATSTRDPQITPGLGILRRSTRCSSKGALCSSDGFSGALGSIRLSGEGQVLPGERKDEGDPTGLRQKTARTCMLPKILNPLADSPSSGDCPGHLWQKLKNTALNFIVPSLTRDTALPSLGDPTKHLHQLLDIKHDLSREADDKELENAGWMESVGLSHHQSISNRAFLPGWRVRRLDDLHRVISGSGPWQIAMTARSGDENDKIPPDTIKIDNPLRIEDSMKKKSTLSRGGEGKTPSGNLPTLNAGRRL
ncbi:hypothetical protein BKA56DRAFT_615173 [Ilyonectria sp. MPI-CAGE-AT-0026]|nr:hypothetical protein BKA56DRAFT_615173 [Ilyonectria sp. MPI-CAGE-AT-0026]